MKNPRVGKYAKMGNLVGNGVHKTIVSGLLVFTCIAAVDVGYGVANIISRYQSVEDPKIAKKMQA